MVETYETSGPRCPYCKHLHRADEPFFYDDENDEMDCDICSRTFRMRIYHSTSWTCETIKDAAETPDA